MLRDHRADARRELEFDALANSASEVILTEFGMYYYRAGDSGAAWRMARLTFDAAPLYRPAHLLADC